MRPAVPALDCACEQDDGHCGGACDSICGVWFRIPAGALLAGATESRLTWIFAGLEGWGRRMGQAKMGSVLGFLYVVCEVQLSPFLLQRLLSPPCWVPVRNILWARPLVAEPEGVGVSCIIRTGTTHHTMWGVYCHARLCGCLDLGYPSEATTPLERDRHWDHGSVAV